MLAGGPVPEEAVPNPVDMSSPPPLEIFEHGALHCKYLDLANFR